MYKTKLAAATLSFLMLAPGLALAQSDNGMTSGDSDFVIKAAQGGMTEVQTSKLALKMSTNDDVKKFAQQMVDDHKKANAKLKSLAKKMNVSLPASLDTAHKDEVSELKTASSADFDQKYIAVQDKEHSDAIAAFQKEADSGDNAQLKAFAAKTLPTLQQHQSLLKTLEQKAPAAATSGGDMNGMDMSK